ncbi:aminotransferase-like domain-containing protein [Cloacibacillus porcorum]|uniref:aminotransferase-like domain-containing protein n=1 Tax=Cloacibacillus porcorum TaxID=1197717 RepID=UPI001459F0FC|nr:PLP-dependent aminotransferase family protein [Cloacibacillus porcorum]MCC8183305.1 PLP-dependent aminotransferase family protein [Cloacibacillus porcorum]MDD7649474.1 PLP-dependent aminotransferase family protein [Cloacibacillus porcorum]MDY4092738.1 PLP-dependent aminotransferase family protein [Cloacibacillus porcorum]MDY5389103.1 PLP-dependent aminotransferase family protein [Cloacibacillus porcorum]NMF18501.1 PLP-dependent aminotransferase family protein [Cloacibacillus porcorum]
MRYSDRILSTPSSFIRDILKVTQDPSVISFAGGLPNPISFPEEALKESACRIIDNEGGKVFQYSTTEGHLPLRQFVADKYNKNFGLNITPEDVLITTGSQQALDLIAKTLLNKGDRVIIEEPGYLGAIQAFCMFEPEFLPVTLEDDGLDLKKLEEALKKERVKFAYVVPNFQNPTGLTYSKERREAVCALFDRYDTVLVEDDPYGELRFKGEKLPYIGAGRLPHSVLLGTFSKTVTPGMRLGFIITQDKELMNHLVTAKQSSDLHTNIFSQYMIADYLAHNEYQKHVDKIIALYKGQAEAMLAAMKEYFPAHVKYTEPEGGMFIWVTLPEGQSALDLFHKAMEKKVAFVPGDPFYAGKTNVNTFRLNYTNSTPETIREGIKRLAEVL